MRGLLVVIGNGIRRAHVPSGADAEKHVRSATIAGVTGPRTRIDGPWSRPAASHAVIGGRLRYGPGVLAVAVIAVLQRGGVSAMPKQTYLNVARIGRRLRIDDAPIGVVGSHVMIVVRV